jgi:hypothetical protein
MAKPIPTAELLSRYDVAEGGCWQWAGYKNHLGYGRAHIKVGERKYKLVAVHRLAFEHHRGPIPHGRVVMHICDNPACINPDHLKLGTQADNLADMRAKGRHPNHRPPPPPELPKALPPIQDGVKFRLWLESARMGVAPIEKLLAARRRQAG